MKKIPLTQGQYAIVDDEDYEALSKHKWCAAWSNACRTYYAVRSVPGRKNLVQMHRVITNAKGKQQTDHRDHNGLNNRRSNLRAADSHTNAQNRRKPRRIGGCSSRFKGVHWVWDRRRWEARIKPKGYPFQLRLGYFTDEVKAAEAYDDGARKYFGEFAQLNFPKRVFGLSLKQRKALDGIIQRCVDGGEPEAKARVRVARILGRIADGASYV
jgi:hypothetical protein